MITTRQKDNPSISHLAVRDRLDRLLQRCLSSVAADEIYDLCDTTAPVKCVQNCFSFLTITAVTCVSLSTRGVFVMCCWMQNLHFSILALMYLNYGFCSWGKLGCCVYVRALFEKENVVATAFISFRISRETNYHVMRLVLKKRTAL